jgi:hypothetical protein
METGNKPMTNSAKKEKIIASIRSRGWFTVEIYQNEAQALCNAGVIKRGEKYFLGGNCKPVWIAA